MIFKKKVANKCTLCSNEVPEIPAIIRAGDHEFKICNECERLFQTLSNKMEEKLDDESL